MLQFPDERDGTPPGHTPAKRRGLLSRPHRAAPFSRMPLRLTGLPALAYGVWHRPSLPPLACSALL